MNCGNGNSKIEYVAEGGQFVDDVMITSEKWQINFPCQQLNKSDK